MSKNKWNRGLAAAAMLAALAACQSVFASEPLALSLEDAMDRAFKTNPAVTEADYGVKSAKAGYDAALSGYGVTIKGVHQSGRAGTYADDTTPASGAHSNQLKATLPLYSGGALEGAAQQGKAGYKSALAGQQGAYNSMRATVTANYLGLLMAERTQQLCEESVKRMTDHLNNVQAQYDVGVVARADLLRSQVELANSEQALIAAKSQRDVQEATLNRIVGLPMTTRLKLDNLLVYTPYDQTLEYCLNYSEYHRPELAQAKYNVDAMKGALLTAKSGYVPSVGLAATQNFGSSSNPPTNWQGSWSKSSWTVGLEVDWTIFDSGVTFSKIHGAEADLKVAEEQYRDKKDEVALAVRSDYLNLREAEQRIKSTDKAVDAAEEDYRIAQLRYMAGVGTNTDVMDASYALDQAKNNYLQAMHDYNANKNSLRLDMGEPMAAPYKLRVDPAKTVEDTLAKEHGVKPVAKTDAKTAPATATTTVTAKK